MHVRILSRCPLDPFRQRCPYCKGAGYSERWIPLALVRYVLGGMSYIILNRRAISASPIDRPEMDTCGAGEDFELESHNRAAADQVTSPS